MQPNTPQGLKPHGFSDYARPNGPRWRPKAVSRPTLRLPQPQDVPRGVVVAVQTRPTVWAGVPANRQTFLHDDPAARTGLAGERGSDRLHSLPGSCSLESEDGQERAPPGIGDALGQGVVLHQVADPQVFVIDHVVLLDELTGFLVVKVAPLVVHVLMGFGEQHHRLA